MEYSNLHHPPSSRKSSTHMGDDELAGLDSNILGQTSPHISPAMKVRSISFADNAPPYSTPEGSTWPGFPYSIETGAVGSSNTTQSFMHPTMNATFAQAAPSQSAPFSPQSSWPLNTASGSCTPTPGYENTGDFTNDRGSSFEQHSAQGLSISAYEGLQLHSAHGFHSSVGFPTSPQSSKGGWVSTSSSDGIDFRSMPNNAAAHSPSFVGSTQILRRDGIRKKNARFEIPAERNLRTIDQLINQTSDEQEIKELKQQKRLLRNRQAALDSRQRKKQHTERLEEEKKHYTSMIGELEEALSDMKVQEADWLRAKENWETSQQQYQRYIESLVLEKEELVRRHTIETGELRKKNAILVDQMQRMDPTSMSTASSSTGFSADFSDFEHLPMNNWDDFSIANDFTIESESQTGAALGTPSKKEPGKAVSEDDKTATSGFLLMLLLCGAWVASHNSQSSIDLLPTIPEEIKTASVTILDNIYRDSGIQLQSQSQPKQRRMTASVQGVTQPTPKTTLSAFELASLSQSSLENFHHRLIAPNDRQMHEQAFSLTPSQYNDLSSPSIYHQATVREGKTTRSVGEILSTSNVDTTEGAMAETYTKSLMMDMVSTRVLKDFARMVAQTTHVDCNHWKAEPID